MTRASLLAAPALAFALAASAWCSDAVAAPMYSFVNFDAPGTGGYTYASGINNAGQVVGSTGQASVPGTTGYIRNADGSFTILSDPNGNSTSAYGINNSGQVVGSFVVPSTGVPGAGGTTGGTFGFLFDPVSGSYTTIANPFSPGLNIFASGINDSGTIVGTYLGSGRVNRGFELFSNGTAVSLTDPNATNVNEGDQTFAEGINNAGTVVGSYDIRPTPFANYLSVGFVFDPASGTYTSFTAAAAYLGPIYPYGTGLYAISSSGLLIGGYFNSSNQPVNFLYDPSSGSYTTLTDPAASGTKTFLSGINDAGQIVGDYQDANGITHGFIATPVSAASAVPEPSSLVLLGAGLGLIAVRLRQKA